MEHELDDRIFTEDADTDILHLINSEFNQAIHDFPPRRSPSPKDHPQDCHAGETKCIDFGKRLTGNMPFNDGSIAFGTIRLYNHLGTTYIKGCDEDGVHPHTLFTAGLNKKWIRYDGITAGTKDGVSSLRIYLLPEDVNRSCRGSANHTIRDFRKLVRYLLNYVDYTIEAWNGTADSHGTVHVYRKPEMEGEESLFYIFNTLRSPHVNINTYDGSVYGRRSIEDVLTSGVVGLKTSLYPYQKRSIAAMIQKESAPAKIRDPRKTTMLDLYNNSFYLDVDEGVVLRNLPLYFETKGGILAETMGYGKTLICLALVLATRGHYPTLPQDCVEAVDDKLHETVPSLLSMAARNLKHKGLPWKNEFFMLRKAGYHYDSCITELKKYEKAYNEPMIGSANPQRRGKPDYINTIRLCSATLIVVPPNLIIQWQQEISKHIDADALDVLVIDTRDTVVPAWQELVKYDVVLMSKSRFEQEYRDDELNTGSRSRYEAKYKSPLTEVRWLRVICDEGHGFAGSASKTNAMAMLDKMFIERRWVVSGTPSSTLHDVEIGLESIELSPERKTSPEKKGFVSVLEKRQTPVTQESESKDFERLRLIVVNFLKLQPWANGKEDKADWKTYLAPRIDEDGKRHSMPALREVMQTLIVRHQIQDLGCDLALPPLHNKVVHIKPSYYDKLSINLFVMLLTSNYVTSEREDEDYMFHPRNRHKLSTLITNLNNATFYCISFTKEDVQATIDISSSYLDGHIDSVSDRDGILLTQAVLSAKKAIADPGWQAFSTLHEMGTFIGGFPVHAKAAWALDGIETEPLLLGTTQTREVQRHVKARISKSTFSQDPCSSLSGAGIKVMGAARTRASEEQKQRQKTKTSSDQKDIGATEGPQKRAPSTSSTTTSPTKQTSKLEASETTSTHHASSYNPPQSTRTHTYALPPTQILGFASSKLTYLTNRILHIHPDEKSIIFYTHNNIAFFIAEALELLGIPHLIYANTLSVRQRAEYLSQFNGDPAVKVLLMDLKQAGQGLHVASASRVYIVSPIWDAALESQAIKRAHRIGQVREVFVETLVLEGSIEEAMIRRRKESGEGKGRDEVVKQESNIVTKEMKNVRGKKNGVNASGHPMLDDIGMVKVLKDIEFLPIHDGEEKFTRLERTVSLFKNTETDLGTTDNRTGINEEIQKPQLNSQLRLHTVKVQPPTKPWSRPLAVSPQQPKRQQPADQQPERRLNGSTPTLARPSTLSAPSGRSIFGPQVPESPSRTVPVRSPEKRKASRPLDLVVRQSEFENVRGDAGGNGTGNGGGSGNGDGKEGTGLSIGKRVKLAVEE